MGPWQQAADGPRLSTSRSGSGEIAGIEPCAEGATLAGQDNHTKSLFLLQAQARGDDGLEHCIVQRVHLVGPHQAHVSNAILDVD